MGQWLRNGQLFLNLNCFLKAKCEQRTFVERYTATFAVALDMDMLELLKLADLSDCPALSTIASHWLTLCTVGDTSY
jgi:hypothetical protein